MFKKLKLFCFLMMFATIGYSQSQMSALESEMIERANQIRVQQGLQPLQVSTQLQSAARIVVQQRQYSHPQANAQARSQGYSGSVTENLAMGHRSAAEAIDDWNEEQGSVGHHHQMRGKIKLNGQWINGNFTHVGASGSPGGVWVIYFGSQGGVQYSGGSEAGISSGGQSRQTQQAAPRRGGLFRRR